MSAENRTLETFSVAVVVASGFRDKFDFSNPAEDYDKMADMAWRAAVALLKRRDEEMAKLPKWEAAHD